MFCKFCRWVFDNRLNFKWEIVGALKKVEMGTKIIVITEKERKKIFKN